MYPNKRAHPSHYLLKTRRPLDHNTPPKELRDRRKLIPTLRQHLAKVFMPLRALLLPPPQRPHRLILRRTSTTLPSSLHRSIQTPLMETMFTQKVYGGQLQLQPTPLTPLRLKLHRPTPQLLDRLLFPLRLALILLYHLAVLCDFAPLFLDSVAEVALDHANGGDAVGGECLDDLEGLHEILCVDGF